MGESCDLALFFLSFLPSAGELVGVGSLTLGVANRSTGGRSVIWTSVYCSLLPLGFLSRIRSPQPHLILVL